MQTRHWPDHGIPCRERNISSWCRRIVAALCITALCGALSACSAPRIDGRAESEHQPSACESAYWAADASTATMNGRHHIIMRYLAAKQAVGQWSEVAATCTQRFAQGTIRSAQAEHVAVTLGTRIGGNDTYRTVSDDSLRQVLGIDLDGATLGAMSLAEDRAGFVMEVLAARDTPGATLEPVRPAQDRGAIALHRVRLEPRPARKGLRHPEDPRLADLDDRFHDRPERADNGLDGDRLRPEQLAARP